MKIRKYKGERRTYIVRKRKLFCWSPTLGSDEQFHWLRWIELWELLNSSGSYFPISKVNFQAIYGVWPTYWYGGIEYELKEGVAKGELQ